MNLGLAARLGVGIVGFVLGSLVIHYFVGGAVVDKGVALGVKGGKWRWYIHREGTAYSARVFDPTGGERNLGPFETRTEATDEGKGLADDLAEGEIILGTAMSSRPIRSIRNVAASFGG